MHETLLQRLSTVHDKVRTAKSAHSLAIEELEAERREQSRLSQQLLAETSKQRLRLGARAGVGEKEAWSVGVEEERVLCIASFHILTKD